MICEECKRETDKLIMGVCKVCAGDILGKNEKNIKYRKRYEGSY